MWLLPGGRACMVALGGMHGCSRGACMVALGGMPGCSGGHVWLLPGVCMVAPRGHAWLLGGMHGCSQEGVHGCSWGVCIVAPRGACMVAPEGMREIRRDTEIQSMNGWYASYWNAFLFGIFFAENCMK